MAFVIVTGPEHEKQNKHILYRYRLSDLVSILLVNFFSDFRFIPQSLAPTPILKEVLVEVFIWIASGVVCCLVEICAVTSRSCSGRLYVMKIVYGGSRKALDHDEENRFGCLWLPVGRVYRGFVQRAEV